MGLVDLLGKGEQKISCWWTGVECDMNMRDHLGMGRRGEY